MGDRGEGTRAALADALERARAATAGASAADSCAAAPAGGGHEMGAGGASAALSVSAAMALAKGALEGVVVRLVGEVSETSSKRGYKAVYFTVKDADAALPCMMWMGRYKASGVDLAVGQLVELTGRFTLYAAKGRMNFDVFSIELAGEGRLRAQVAALARKLEAEGLMDPARKLPIPQFPLTIGIVTSPRGDAVHDMLRTLRNRFPVARVFVAGVQVEGAQAAASIVEGMRCMYRAGVEVMLVGRGGGSYEDMMPFNDEALARAIAACPIPVVTGIGHEPDTFIADMVADRRASTPTYAAMAVTPTRESLAELFCAHARSLSMSAGRAVERAAAEVRRCVGAPFSGTRTCCSPPRCRASTWPRSGCSAPSPPTWSATAPRSTASASGCRASCPRAWRASGPRSSGAGSACCRPCPPTWSATGCRSGTRGSGSRRWGPGSCPGSASRRRSRPHVWRTCRPCPSSGAATPSRAPRRAPWRSASRTRRLDRRSR